MKVEERLSRLRDRYIKHYTKDATLINFEAILEDAKYSWWEREGNCQQWCNKEGTYVPMSDSKTLKVMGEWFKKWKI